MFYEAPFRSLSGETRVGAGQHVTAATSRPTKRNFRTIETRPSEKTRRKSLFSSVQNQDETIELKPTTWTAVWRRFRTRGRPVVTKRRTRKEFETNKQTDNRFSQKYRTGRYQSAARFTKFCECDEWFPTVVRWTATCQRNPYERTRRGTGDRKSITETDRFYSVKLREKLKNISEKTEDSPLHRCPYIIPEFLDSSPVKLPSKNSTIEKLQCPTTSSV